jgi:asparagine synthase (glutamine-hydrolysing)
MAGFYGVFSSLPISEKDLMDCHYKNEKSNSIQHSGTYQKFVWGRTVLNQLHEDRFEFENESILCFFEGLIFNNHRFNKNTIFHEYKKLGVHFAKEIEGQFSIFILDKQSNQIHLITDHLSHRPLYYFFDAPSNTFIFSSQAIHVAKLIEKCGFTKTIDFDSFKSLLTIGYMYNDATLALEIKKIKHGSSLTFSTLLGKLNITSHFTFSTETKEIKLQDAIEETDRLLINSVNSIWKKQKENHLIHTSLLSGGLDSRVSTLLGLELGYQDVHALTFTQSGVAEEKIASKIASDLKIKHTVKHLDGGQYIIDSIDEYILANDGLVTFIGACHAYSQINSWIKNKPTLLNTGQIGDAVFGSLFQENVNFKTNIESKSFFKNSSINSTNKYQVEIINQYTDFELFGFEQHIINGTLNGDRMFHTIMDSTSPFYDKNLINFGLSLPSSFKKNQFLYIEWMQKKHPKIASYPWAKTGLTPSNSKLNKSLYFGKRGFKYLKKKIGIKELNMNPYDRWVLQNPNILIEFKKIMQNELPKIENQDLKELIQLVFNHKEFYAKTNAITALLAYKNYFGKS